MNGVMDAQLFDRDTAGTYAAWFKALADPIRIQILNLLAVAGDAMSVGEIVERAGVGQSTVSHHLKILNDVRFVVHERRGTSVLCSVMSPAWPASPAPLTLSWAATSLLCFTAPFPPLQTDCLRQS